MASPSEPNSSIKTTMTDTEFWRSIDILLKKPHVVNKRLWGCKILFKSLCSTQIAQSSVLLPTNCRILDNVDDIGRYRALVLQDLCIQECVEENCSVEVVLAELFPKVFTESHAYQLIILWKQINKVMFVNVTPEAKKQKLCPNFIYALQLQDGILRLKSKDTASKSYLWLKDTVLPQFVKWGEECSKTEQKLYTDSLTLVCGERYYQKYNYLKLKYGKDMVKIWPECTDPAKFVYEDIAIATYLLLLWEDERSHLNLMAPQSFVDLGCGNGLLVYILAKEGHTGVGIDVRRRQIWHLFLDDIKLEEKTIIPSDSYLFPETDWIIGNHSDELTPWIPVIAARSSYKCNFFLLPCCAFNFDGSKYCRQNSSKSQYTEYLQCLRQLCEECGFRTDIDRLKIPSTKRICLVGRGRTYPEEEQNGNCSIIQKIIDKSKSCMTKNNIQNQQTAWVKDFRPRETTERIRNCTQVDSTIIDRIVEIISNYLLDGYCLDSSWSIGKAVELHEVVRLISPQDLKALKSECGGIQTLLRNNHQIFKVQTGKVQLRYPKTVKEVQSSIKNTKNKSSNIKLQQKPCWFYNNHPQGCPLKNTDCSFLHVRIKV